MFDVSDDAPAKSPGVGAHGRLAAEVGALPGEGERRLLQPEQGLLRAVREPQQLGVRLPVQRHRLHLRRRQLHHRDHRQRGPQTLQTPQQGKHGNYNNYRVSGNFFKKFYRVFAFFKFFFCHF